MVPNADQEIAFEISGPGAIAAVDSADYISHEPFQDSSRKAFHGSCIAIARATGKGAIAIKASSPGLTGAGVIVTGN